MDKLKLCDTILNKYLRGVSNPYSSKLTVCQSEFVFDADGVGTATLDIGCSPVIHKLEVKKLTEEQLDIYVRERLADAFMSIAELAMASLKRIYEDESRGEVVLVYYKENEDENDG
ncbi:MAG: hypothetical protein DRP65_11715 [Planctomycetota bacterium]|nr:MAG: hypothetical protein DRP65_11715 [Planctomycetota bacterium]